MSQINIQAVCDSRKLFTSYELGWPGSVTDVQILKKSQLWLHRPSHFGRKEFILADMGYPTTPYTLRPFADNDLGPRGSAEEARRKAFNRHLAGQRIVIEHAFGDLKGRFRSLCDLGTMDEMEELYKVVEAMMVLHNICIILEDRPEDIDDFERVMDASRDEESELQSAHWEAGLDGESLTSSRLHETDMYLRTAGRQVQLKALNRLFN